MASFDRPATSRHSPAQETWLDRLAIAARDPLLLLARLLLGAIFVQSGFGKFTRLDGFIGSLEGMGVPMASVLGTIGAGVEFLGGLAIVLGAWTRLAAILMIGFTVASTLIAHRYWEAPPDAMMRQQIQFMKNVAIIGGFLSLIAAGAGRLSIDRFRRHKRT